MSNIQYTNTTPTILPEEKDGIPIEKQKIGEKLIKYCLYARKSSEDDERQALSIDSQIKEMAVQAQTQGLLVTEIRKESHSAKSTGQRPVLNQLISDIRSGIFQGILSWAPDRLSRNAGDLGTIVDLMDNGYLKEIRTHGQTFTNTPNDKFLLMILCSQAKLENDNRGINVKRGFKTKCEMGFRPNMTPLGYKNDYVSSKGQKKVFQDPERAPIIKEAFEKVAYHGYSGRDLHKWINNNTNFRSRKGKRINLSMIYRMLNNPYYCGMFEFPVGSGKWFKGAFEPIVSKELFTEVQNRLAIHPKTRPGTKEFDFVKIFKCGSCGSGVTAEEKLKRTNTGIRRYVYYHCTQSRNFDCNEPYIREEELIESLIGILDSLSIDQIRAQEKLNEKLKMYQRFNSVVLGNDIQNDPISKQTDHLKSFIGFIFAEGTKEEKRDLLDCLKTTLYLKDKKIVRNI